MMLLNPGPVNVSERVRRALNRPDICHRESDFAELQHGIQNKLLNAFVPGAETDYTAVLIIDWGFRSSNMIGPSGRIPSGCVLLSGSIRKSMPWEWSIMKPRRGCSIRGRPSPKSLTA